MRSRQSDAAGSPVLASAIPQPPHIAVRLLSGKANGGRKKGGSTAKSNGAAESSGKRLAWLQERRTAGERSLREMGFIVPQVPLKVRKGCAAVLGSNAVRLLAAGALAGAISNTAVAPLDRMRINLMVRKDSIGIWELVKEIYQQGGVLGFWQGNTADVIRTVPSSAIRFFSFATYKSSLPGLGVSSEALGSLLAGGFAGMTAMAACYPLETLRTRMAVTVGSGSLTTFAKTIVRTEGVSSLYRGLMPSLISVMPYFGVRFGLYDILKRWYATLPGAPAEPSARAIATFGITAGLAASCTTFPFEMVRRRAMVGGLNGARNPVLALVDIARADGIRGLYRGYGFNLIKVAPSAACSFFVYESARRMLDAASLAASASVAVE